ncbi:hypothetical protein BBP00_00010052 [Phytophthora kernoviae]|uniref:Uncharacterized protein n=1 Tax=Phytophthora kernoviae TaxID=325452 RepID=A0A3F2RAY8_9STRA|nr:hypothetical protein BBP00_00010052 [Phytophthora kernoviae]
MIDAELQQSNASNQEDGRNGYATIVDTVTLNSDLMLVRTVHQIMYEFPSNPRLQLLGQAILSKLLPSAFQGMGNSKETGELRVGRRLTASGQTAQQYCHFRMRSPTYT